VGHPKYDQCGEERYGDADHAHDGVALFRTSYVLATWRGFENVQLRELRFRQVEYSNCH
jgi:hypothetical protein